MTPFKPLPSLVPSLLARLRAWPAASQQGSRRNAMVACTALAQRRAERQDVEDFLTALAAEPTRHYGASP